MNVLQIRREVARARTGAGAIPSSASHEMVVAAIAGRLDVSFNSPRERPIELEREAGACLEATLTRLPEALRGGLVVETGWVRSRVSSNEGEEALFAQRYRTGTCLGVVLGIQDTEEAEPFALPWTGILDEPLAPDLPVVLGPSAVLALVSYALETAGGEIAASTLLCSPALTVLDTAASPYPPQHHPFDENGPLPPSFPLIDEGRWWGREENGIDPLFFLLTRPDRALRPLAAATHFNRRNLAVGCSRRVPAPSPAVLVDSWRVRVGPRSGAVPFQAHLSRIGPDTERLALASAVVLQCDPWELLAQIRGACGPTVPALDEDPIEGDSYGAAPTLVTGVTLAGLTPAEKL